MKIMKELLGRNNVLSRKMHKKAFVFVLDGIIAIIILSIGYLIISSQASVPKNEVNVALISENTMEILVSVELEDIIDLNCTTSVSLLESYCNDGKIGSFDQSILDYFGELYYKDEKNELQDLFNFYIEEYELIDTELFGYELIIEDESLVVSSDDQDSSKTLISAKKVLVGYYEDIINGEIYFWGPYILHISIWERV